MPKGFHSNLLLNAQQISSQSTSIDPATLAKMKLISFIALTLLSFSSAKTINDEDIAIGVLFPEDDSHCKSGESKRLQNALTNAYEQVEPYIGRRNLREGRNLSAWCKLLLLLL